jgi:hypothetical protein
LKNSAQEDDGDSDEEARQARVIQRMAERTAAERPAFFYKMGASSSIQEPYWKIGRWY